MNRDSHLIFEAYKLHGLAANKTVEDIAKKHNVDVESIKTQLAKGIQVEHEHTTDEQTAKKIAMDHIYENPHYYDKLKKMEGEEDYVEKRKEKFDRAMDKYKDRENERDEKLKDSEENAESKHCEYAMKGCRCGKCSECTPRSEDAEASPAFHYDPMPGLEKTANQIRDLLQGAANDEARTEHIIRMAQTILGSPKDYNPNEYRKMLDGLIVLLNRFIVVPMNEYEEQETVPVPATTPVTAQSNQNPSITTADPREVALNKLMETMGINYVNSMKIINFLNQIQSNQQGAVVAVTPSTQDPRDVALSELMNAMKIGPQNKQQIINFLRQIRGSQMPYSKVA